jgi:hypothetical protein
MTETTVLHLPCPVSGCDRERRSIDELLCPRCWYRVPKRLRHRVWAKFRLYQDGRLPLAELRATQSDAIESVQL